MDKNFKAKWIEALRSGDYTQARETLNDKGAMCCLGVLLDVSGLGEWNGNTYIVFDDGDRTTLEGDLCSFRGKFDITREEQGMLIHMNDGTEQFKDTPQSFTEIADYIEAKL